MKKKGKPPLDQVLGELVGGGVKHHVPLAKGLVLAFTPAGENNGRFRLCLSRKGKEKPSDQEAKTVTHYLGLALAKIGVDYVDVTRVDMVIGGWPCVVIEWVEVKRVALFDLPDVVNGDGLVNG